MFFSECDVLPARQSSSPGAAVPSFEDLSGEDFCVFFVFLLHGKNAATIDAQQIEKSRPRLRQGSEMAPKSTPKWYPEPPFSQPEQIPKIDTSLQRNCWFGRSGRSRKHPQIKKRTLRKRGATKDPYFPEQQKQNSIWLPFWDPSEV